LPSLQPTDNRSFALDPHTRRIAIVVVLSMIMSVLDTTIVNVAVESLSRDLHAPLNQIQWVVSAYLLALAAVIPFSGWAVRRYGAFRVYMWGLVLFTVGSALCGLARTADELIAFRVLQGLGGGMLAPTGLTILVNSTDREGLPKLMSVIGVVLVLAPVFGPTFGGFLLQSVSWHAIFLVNVPIGIVTGVLAVRMLPRDKPDKGAAGRLDWVGMLLAALGTVGITYGLSQSATAGSFTSPSVIFPTVVGSVLVVLFVLRARRIKNPLLDLRLYSIRAYSSATVVMFCMGGALFGAMVLLPLYFQIGRGEDAIHTGLMLIPQGLGASVGMYASAPATRRYGAGLTSLFGVSIVAAATLPYLFVNATTSYAVLAAAMVVRGVGVGFAMMPAMTAAFSPLSHDQVHDASPQLNVIQRVGGSLGTAVIAVVLQTKLAALSAHGRVATPGAIAQAFDETYRWVVLMLFVALIPATVLWRVERRLRVEGQEGETSDESLVEALL
jgi:EmrB/QacA subfamily drug resistance transporter